MTMREKVGVFVYGDIGRSPRMQNHSEQLSKTYQVYLMGYVDSCPREAITENQHIHLVDLEINGLGTIRRKSFYIYALVRIFLQLFQILYLLGWRYRGMKFVLVQNPPSIPSLMGIWIASFLSWFKIYIDFHNYGFTILGLKIKSKIILYFAKKYQQFFGRKCFKAFCVSKAMKDDLFQSWKIQAEVLYDRPRENFVPEYNLSDFCIKYDFKKPSPDQLVLVSSTSWTKDEDFSILLDAIDSYDQLQTSKKKIRAYITGKGPQKGRYMRRISEMKDNWTKVSIEALWLEADDYPVLLSLCHIGVSLHYSSSGVDLPMKVVDMFGAGVPVLAIHYSALSELVKDGENGFIFKDSNDLLQKLITLTSSESQLSHLKKGASKEQTQTWEKQWRKKFIIS